MAVTILGLTIGDNGSGFYMPTLAEWRAAIAAKIVELRGVANLHTEPGSEFGDIVDIVSQGVDIAAQSASEAVSQSKFTAMVGVALDQFLADILLRVPATPSTSMVWIYGSAGSNVGVNQIIRTSPTSTGFLTTAPSVIPAEPTTDYGIDITNFPAGTYNGTVFTITVDGTDAIYAANNVDTGLTVKNGLIAAINALALTQMAFDGGQNPVSPKRQTLIIRETQGGGPFAVVLTVPGIPAALFSFPAISVLTSTGAVVGPTVASARALRYGPGILGVIGYTNILDATLGRLRETDSQYKARHQITQRGLGGGSPDAVRGIMLSPVSIGGGGLSYCAVEYNPTDLYEPMPIDNKPHSLRIVANPDVNPTDLGNALWRAKAAGDDTNGPNAVIIQDSQGGNHTLYYDTLVDQWVSAIITIEVGNDWPATGVPLDQLRQDVTNYIDGLQPTGNAYGVRVNQLPISLLPNGLPRGVANFTVSLGIGAENGPYSYLDVYPTAEPDAEDASVQLTSRQKPRCKIDFVFATIVVVP